MNDSPEQPKQKRQQQSEGIVGAAAAAAASVPLPDDSASSSSSSEERRASAGPLHSTTSAESSSSSTETTTTLRRTVTAASASGMVAAAAASTKRESVVVASMQNHQPPRATANEYVSNNNITPHYFDLTKILQEEPPEAASERALPEAGCDSTSAAAPTLNSVGQGSFTPSDVVTTISSPNSNNNNNNDNNHESNNNNTANDISSSSSGVDFYGRPRSTKVVRKWPSQLMFLMSQSTGDDEWLSVLDRIRTNPHEVAIQGINGGMNALHAACVRYPPLTVVQACVAACPKAALQRNFNGETPLHIATYSASEEVQSFMATSVPQACQLLDQYGDAPLHAAARAGASLGLMETLLRAAPEMSSQRNARGVTPFWLLPRSYLESGEDDLEEEVLCHEHGEEYRDDWDSLALFLRYSYHKRLAEQGVTTAAPTHPPVRDMDGLPLAIQRQDYTWMVHAAAATPACPRVVLRWLCRQFPEQALVKDGTGRTPLMWACESDGHWQEPRLRWNQIEDGIRDEASATQQNRGPLQNEGDQVMEEDVAMEHMGNAEFLEQVLFQQPADNSVASGERARAAAEPEQSDNEDERSEEGSNSQNSGSASTKQSAMEILLEWSPKSALIQKDERWPLTLALVHGSLPWENGIRPLIAACPRALEARDTETGLYNFQLAAMKSPQLDTVYSLVRSLPELLLASIEHQPQTNAPKPMGKRKNDADYCDDEEDQPPHKKQK